MCLSVMDMKLRRSCSGSSSKKLTPAMSLSCRMRLECTSRPQKPRLGIMIEEFVVSGAQQVTRANGNAGEPENHLAVEQEPSIIAQPGEPSRPGVAYQGARHAAANLAAILGRLNPIMGAQTSYSAKAEVCWSTHQGKSAPPLRHAAFDDGSRCRCSLRLISFDSTRSDGGSARLAACRRTVMTCQLNHPTSRC